MRCGSSVSARARSSACCPCSRSDCATVVSPGRAARTTPAACWRGRASVSGPPTSSRTGSPPATRSQKACSAVSVPPPSFAPITNRQGCWRMSRASPSSPCRDPGPVFGLVELLPVRSDLSRTARRRRRWRRPTRSASWTRSPWRVPSRRRNCPVEAVEAVLDRLDRLDPTLHMFTTVMPDQAQEDAKRIEADIAAGRGRPLAGVPTGVKDLICTKGIRTASGSYAYADFVPDEDDVVVERIKAAGAVMIGKTQVPEFGYSGTGRPRWRSRLATPGTWSGPPVAPRPDRRRGGHRGGAILAGQRRRRLGPDPRQLLRGVWHQADDGPGPAVPGHQGPPLPGRVELGVPGAHRAADPHRRRRRPGAVGDRRLRRPGPPEHPRRHRLAARRRRRPGWPTGCLQPGPWVRRRGPCGAGGRRPGGHGLRARSCLYGRAGRSWLGGPLRGIAAADCLRERPCGHA